MKRSKSSESQKLDRKTVERNRRIQMKGLCFKLVSLIPSHHFKPSKEMLPLPDQIGQAASYITQLRERVEKLKNMKEQATGSTSDANDNETQRMMMTGIKLPVFELRDLGSGINLVLISGLNKNFMLHEVISILEEEGAEVVSASFSTVGHKVFHAIHAQVRISRVGVETTRVYQRLKDLIH